MSSRAEPLLPAVEVARKRSEDALTKLATQQQRLAKAEQQLVELRRYRLEYAATGPGGADVMTVSALMNRQSFVDRIDEAIAQQVTEISRLQRQFEQVRGRWHEAHARESALDCVVERYTQQERAADDRHEQAEMDELFQRRRQR